MDEKKLILVVEDSKTQAEKLKVALEKGGYSVTVVPNGREALKAMAIRIPDLVLTDMQMPDMDGLALCREIRRDRTWSNLPIIVMTASQKTMDCVHALSAGATAFERKPVNIKKLLEDIEFRIRQSEEKG